MADAGGSGAKLGVRLLTQWTDGYTAPGAGHLVPFTKESLSAAFDRIEDESLVGSGSRPASDQGALKAQGEIEHELDYNNFDTIFEAFCGANAARVFTMTNDNLPKYPLAEFEKVIARHRYYAAKIGGLVISGQANGKVTLKTKWHPRQRVISGTAFPGACTLAGARTRVLFKHLSNNFRIGDQVDALGAGDVLGISSFELTLDRNLKADDNDSQNPTYVLEPIPGGWRAASLKLTLPRYNATTAVLATWKDADTALQARFVFTGSGETFTIELPNLRITSGFDVPVEGPGPIKFDGELSAHPSTAGNPMYVGEEVRFTFT